MHTYSDRTTIHFGHIPTHEYRDTLWRHKGQSSLTVQTCCLAVQDRLWSRVEFLHKVRQASECAAKFIAVTEIRHGSTLRVTGCSAYTTAKVFFLVLHMFSLFLLWDLAVLTSLL